MKRTPVKKETIYDNRKTMMRWKLMREAEKKKFLRKKKFTLYKNNWLLTLVYEATKVRFWPKWHLTRLKKFRLELENVYHIPINFYSAFVYFSTYQYLHWQRRQRDYSNFVGFLCSDFNIERFARFIATRPLLWRRKNSRWPDDYHQVWGIKTSLKAQTLGIKDKIVRYPLMSEEVRQRINKHL